MHISANTVTVVIALSAILSPILVAIINNHHNAKMKKLELQSVQDERNMQYIYSIYENYLQSTSKCIANPTDYNLNLYGENYSIALAYFPQEYHELLKGINESIRNRNWDSANTMLEILSIRLSSVIKPMLAK